MAISPIPGVRPPRPPICLCQLWLRGYLTYPCSTHTTPSQVWLSHPSLKYAHHAHLSASACCGYLTYPWRTHTTPSQVWLCGYLTHPWSTPTTPTSLPLPAVAMWLSHLSLEYAYHAQPGVAISPIPEVRPPNPLLCICQLWLRGYLTSPGIMPTTPTLLPAVATWLLINPWSRHTTPSQMCLSHLSLEYAHHAHPLPAVATWLSHLSLEHAHHARPSISCGYGALPPIPGVCPTHLAICQVWLHDYLPYPSNTPATPTLCQWRLYSYLIVRRAGLLWSQQDFECRWSVPLFKCLTVLEFSFILFDLCLLITFFNFIMNYVPITTFWIFTYHKFWILSIMFCVIWSYWIIYFLACLEVSWRVVS